MVDHAREFKKLEERQQALQKAQFDYEVKKAEDEFNNMSPAAKMTIVQDFLQQGLIDASTARDLLSGINSVARSPRFTTKVRSRVLQVNNKDMVVWES